MNAVLAPMADVLLSAHMHSYVNTENYHRVLQGGHQIELFSLLQPSLFEGFGEVILMGAGLKSSLLYIIWSAMGVVQVLE